MRKEDYVWIMYLNVCKTPHNSQELKQPRCTSITEQIKKAGYVASQDKEWFTDTHNHMIHLKTDTSPELAKLEMPNKWFHVYKKHRKFRLIFSDRKRVTPGRSGQGGGVEKKRDTKRPSGDAMTVVALGLQVHAPGVNAHTLLSKGQLPI